MFIRRLILQSEKPMLLHCEPVIYDPARPLIEAEMESRPCAASLTEAADPI